MADAAAPTPEATPEAAPAAPMPTETQEAAPETKPGPRPGEGARAWAEQQRAKKEYERRAAEYAAKEKTILEREARAREIEELVAKDPVAFFKERGGLEAYRELTNRLVAEQKSPEEVINQLQSKIASLEEAIPKMLEEKLGAVKSEITSKEAEKLYNDYRKTAESVIASEEFRGLAPFGGVDDVIEYAENHYATTGKVLTPEEAARTLFTWVRDEYVPQMRKSLEEFDKLSQAQKPNDKATDGTKSKPKPKTLTNDAVSDGSAGLAGASKSYRRDEIGEVLARHGLK